MKFILLYTENIPRKVLSYDVEECSFSTDPVETGSNFEIALNTLNMSVDNQNRLIQVWGFCGYSEWAKSNHTAPNCKKGIVEVVGEYEGGFGSFTLSEKIYPVFVNDNTGWVCIGDPKKQENAIEFLDNCILVVNNAKLFVSLWLKPQALPSTGSICGVV